MKWRKEARDQDKASRPQGRVRKNNTSFLVKFSALVFIAMSSELTIGDNSDEFTFFRFFLEFG